MTTKKDCKTGNCPLPTEPPTEPIKPTLVDPFKPLGVNQSGAVTTYSFAGEIAGVFYLKTVTVTPSGQSEYLAPIPNVQIVPSNIEGFYKLVSK